MVKNKFIAFVGNLPYETTEEELKEFFKGLGELEIRMRYSKEGKSKGFCFVECKDNGQFQKLLKMHHLKLNSRKINIELSAGGGGNSKTRKEKIKKKNEKITKFRQSLHENMVKKRPDPSSERPKKRFNTPNNTQYYPS